MDDPGCSHERVWTRPVVNRSGEICGFAVCTPGGDEYVEALTVYSFCAQTTRQGSAFAYQAEADGNVVQFSEVVSDDGSVRLIRVGRGLAEEAAMGCPGAGVDLNSCYNFFEERIAVACGATEAVERTYTSEPSRTEQVRTRPRGGVHPVDRESRGEVSSTNLEEGTHHICHFLSQL